MISQYLTGKSLSNYSDFEDMLIFVTKLEKEAFEFYSNLSKCVDNPDLKKTLYLVGPRGIKTQGRYRGSLLGRSLLMRYCDRLLYTFKCVPMY